MGILFPNDGLKMESDYPILFQPSPTYSWQEVSRTSWAEPFCPIIH